MKKFLCLWGVLSACCGFAATTLNIADFGAVGSGVADDSAAIARAVAELGRHSDAELFFPAGYYRVAARNEAAMIFEDVTDVAVRFAAGAVLLMDNQGTEAAPCHAVVVKGKAANISFDGVNIQWKNPPQQPGPSCAFVFDPAKDGDRVVNLRIGNCSVTNVPGDAFKCVGVDGITVRSFNLTRSFGNGMSFSGCTDIDMLNVNLRDVTGCGVNFAAASPADRVPGTPWSNRRVVIRQLELDAGNGGGILFAGVDDIAVDIARIDGRAFGLMVQSGQGVPAPLKANLSDIEISACSAAGIGLVCADSDDPEARDFPVRMRKLSLNGCGSGNLYLCNADGASVATLRSSRGKVVLEGVRNAVLNDLRLRGGCYFLADRVAGDRDRGDAEEGYGVVVDRLLIDRGHLEVRDSAGICFVNSSVADSPVQAVEIAGSQDLFFEAFKIIRPNRDNAADAVALRIENGDRIVFDNFRMELDMRKVVPMYLSGGDISITGELDAPDSRYELTGLLEKPSPLAGDFPEVTLSLKVSLGDETFELHSSGDGF